MKMIYWFLIIGVFFIGIVGAFLYFSSPSKSILFYFSEEESSDLLELSPYIYDINSKTAIIMDGAKLLAEASLETPQHYGGFDRGNRVKQLVGEVSIGDKSTDAMTIKNIEVVNLKNNKTITKDVEFRLRQVSYKNITDYIRICKNRSINNGTKGIEYYDCKDEEVGSHLQPEYSYVKFDEKSYALQKDDVIGIFADVERGDLIEWFITFEIDSKYYKVIEWATWGDSMNTGLVGAYTMNDMSNQSQVKDDFEGFYNLTDMDGGIYNTTNCKIGNCTYSDLTGSIEGTTPAVTNTEPYSISGWVRKVGHSANAFYGHATTDLTGFYIGEVDIGGNDHRVFSQASSGWGSGGKAGYHTDFNKLPLGTWIHVAMVYNGTEDGDINVVKVYINGSFMKYYGTSWNNDIGAFSKTLLAIGGTSGNDYTNIMADAVHFWNRTLTDGGCSDDPSQSYVPCTGEIGDLWNEGNALEYTPIPSDSVPPNVTIVSPLNQNYSQSHISFNITVADDYNMSLCWYNVGDANVTMSNDSLTNYYHVNTSIVDGVYTALYYCNDTSNNINGSESVLFEVDTTAPVIYLDSPANQSYATATIDLNASSDEGTIDTWWYSNNSGSTNITFTPNESHVWDEGSNTVWVWANDSTNNIGSNSTTFIVDTTAPNLVIHNPAHGGGYNTAFMDINVSGDENLSHCEYRTALSSWEWGDEGSPYTDTINMTRINDTFFTHHNTTMVDDIHYLGVRCNDTMGNMNGSMATIFFLLDTQPPYFTNISDQEIEQNQSLYHDINASDVQSANVWFKINWTTNFTINLTTGILTNSSVLTPANYYINVSVNDSLGNVNSTTLWVNVTKIIDIDPPTWDNLRNFSHTANTSFSESITASDNIAIDSYVINDTNFTVNSATGLITNATALGTAQYRLINYTVNDTSNNILTSLFYINITAPRVAVTTGLDVDDMYLAYNYEMNELNQGDMRFSYGFEW
jgi:hypothetical protein